MSVQKRPYCNDVICEQPHIQGYKEGGVGGEEGALDRPPGIQCLIGDHPYYLRLRIEKFPNMGFTPPD